ncbi:MAG: two-component system response regulator [Flaviaesturariibacter sp.]|nr:two-component system response regulator [Flaviaesturariibacter sp.]
MTEPKYKVYLVDDDQDDLEILSAAFVEAGCTRQLQCFTSAPDLLHWFTAYPNDTLPDIIILDHQMPRMDGMDVVRELRSSKRFNSIALAICSTVLENSRIHNLLLNGADCYIEKGSNYYEIKEHVALFCEAIVKKQLEENEYR